MEALLDAARPLDVGLLERTVNALNSSRDERERSQANYVLTALKEGPSAWESAGAVLEQSKDTATRFFALQVLEEAIKFRWRALPEEQRQGIRNYVVQKIIHESSDEAAQQGRAGSGKMFRGKLNLILVHILKHEWPHNWPDFMQEILASSAKSEALCENSMQILKLLCEEVFTFSKEEMTSDKVAQMKTRLKSEFQGIFELCQLVLDRSTRPGLARITLQTLLGFIAWIPFEYIFESPLVDQLLGKFLVAPAFRNDTLACLTEIVAFEQPRYNPVFGKIFLGVMALLDAQLPPETDIPVEFERAGDGERAFVRGLSLFLTTIFSHNLCLLEQAEYAQRLIDSMFYLVSISMVQDDDVFKICLEFWNKFVRSLYAVKRSDPASARLAAYTLVLSRVRRVMIIRMAKPEEVLVVEDEDGSIVRETTKDTDAIAQYKLMRDTVVFLCHLDAQDTEEIMVKRLVLLCDENSADFSFTSLNTLCWAIGSVSGAMTEEAEKSFLVTVIRKLLQLVEVRHGKDNKAVIASNIMYVVGQYPRFLHAHWTFLRTVVDKLFEFMHELHPGVQDMACDTFLKIARKCPGQFVVGHPNDETPYIERLLDGLNAVVVDLSAHQRLTFFEAVGHMVRQEADEGRRANLLERLMRPGASAWRRLMDLGEQSPDLLQEPSNLRVLADLLRVQERVCRAMGQSFRPQLSAVFGEVMRVYAYLGATIAKSVAEGGAVVTQHKQAKLMRVVKVECLHLTETFVKSAERADAPGLVPALVPSLIDSVLADYASNPPAARNAEVLQLLAVVFDKLSPGLAGPDKARLVEGLFVPALGPTLELITGNLVDHPEHRHGFYALLRPVSRYCFEQLFSTAPQVQQNVMDAITWAIKHTERNVAENGLGILERLLKNVARAPEPFQQAFYARYFLSLVMDVLEVLTDRLHKSCFPFHASVLQALFRVVQEDRVKAALDPQGARANRQFLLEHVTRKIVEVFPNVGAGVARAFVEGMFDPQKDFSLFKAHVRDFLVRLREFSRDGGVDELFAAEREEQLRKQEQEALAQRAQVPGLLTQREAEEMADL